MSRGEYLNGLLLADYLGFDFIDSGRYSSTRTAYMTGKDAHRDASAQAVAHRGDTGRLDAGRHHQNVFPRFDIRRDCGSGGEG